MRVLLRSALVAALLAALPAFIGGASASSLMMASPRDVSDRTLLDRWQLAPTKVAHKRRARRGDARAKQRTYRRHHRRFHQRYRRDRKHYRRAHRRFHRHYGRRHRDGIYIGIYPYYDPWFYSPRHYDPFYDYPYYGYTYDDEPRLSCKRVRRLLRRHGYRKLRAYDCKGRTYGFYARYRGKRYKLRVNAYSGNVRSRRRY